MSKRKTVPVMSFDSKDRLFHKGVEEARDMVSRAVAYVVTEHPLVIALASPPKNHRIQIDIERLRPDRSLTVGRGVVHGAALGEPGCVEIIDGHAGWRTPRFQNDLGIKK